MQKQRIVLPRMNGRNDKGLILHRKGDMTNQCFVENFMDRFVIVCAASG